MLHPLYSILLADQNVCWRWHGHINRDGYGRYGHNASAHRVVYETLIGPIPAGLVIDHLCRNRCCVNPLHMEPVTDRENRLRGVAARTRCINGHAFTTENTRLHKGARICRKCECDRTRAYKIRQAQMSEVHP